MFSSTTVVKLCLPLALLVCAAPALAQARDTTKIPPAVAYEMGKKSPWAAVGIEWLLPTAGFAYAKNWKRGLLPNAVAFAGFGMMVAGVDDTSEDLAAAGVLAFCAGRIWAFIGAANTANAYNRRLSERLQVTPQANGSVGIGLTLPTSRPSTQARM